MRGRPAARTPMRAPLCRRRSFERIETMSKTEALGRQLEQNFRPASGPRSPSPEAAAAAHVSQQGRQGIIKFAANPKQTVTSPPPSRLLPNSESWCVSNVDAARIGTEAVEVPQLCCQ